MDKIEFLLSLEKALSGLPREELNEHIDFYNEIIEDKIEEGLSEEEAVSEIGPVEEIVSQVISETSLTKLVKGKIKPKRKLKAWEIILLALASPAWLSLLIAAFAVILSVYITVWAVVISLWAVFVSLIGCAFGCVASGVVFACNGNIPTGIAAIGTAFVCAGLSIFMFFVCRIATKGVGLLTKKTIIGIKNCFIKKEEA